MIRLNLLPPEYRNDIEVSKKNARLYQYLIKLILGIVAAGAFMGVVGFFVWENQSIAQVSRDDAYSQLTVFGNVENEAKDFSSRLNLIQKLRADRIDWQLVFSQIASSTPSNVRIVSLDFTNAGSDRISFNGFALNNADVGSFRELLSHSALFKFVDIESISSGSDPGNTGRAGVNFRITLNLNVTEAKK
jgi:Tfp pilus assembly protein PilN